MLPKGLMKPVVLPEVEHTHRLRVIRVLGILVFFSALRAASFFVNTFLYTTEGTKKAWLPCTAILFGLTLIQLLRRR